MCTSGPRERYITLRHAQMTSKRASLSDMGQNKKVVPRSVTYPSYFKIMQIFPKQYLPYAAMLWCSEKADTLTRGLLFFLMDSFKYTGLFGSYFDLVMC